MADNTTLNTGAGGDVIATDDIGGVKYQRVKVTFGVDGAAADVTAAVPLPTQVINTSRTFIHLWAIAAAAGTTTTETAITLTRSGAPGAATSAAASFTPTSGKRFRITSISVATRGNATATAQTTTFNLRVNTAGAVATTSNVWLALRSATPATASAWDRTNYLNVDGDGPEILGDGTVQFGITAAATYTTNAPTWDVSILGYEY